MSQKVTRKAPSARKVAAAQGTARKVRSAKAKTGSALDRTLAALPFSDETLHRIVLGLILGGAAALAWTMANLAGVPLLASRQFAMLAADAGFEVRRIDLHGVKQINELEVYGVVLPEPNQPMPLVDTGAIRERLMDLPWIAEARVSRQLPDTLVVHIVERTPHAVLRKAGGLVLIDASGEELETISPARARGQLVVSGAGAGKQVVALGKLLDAAPALRPQVREAQWVGNRRWNLTFRTGQVLALPEGGKPAADALVNFARLDGTNRLLGGRVAAFDMRAADRIYMRIPGRAEQEIKDAATARTAAANAAAAARKASAASAADEDQP